MAAEPVRLLSFQQARMMADMAEQAQAGRNRLACNEVAEDATLLQLLDEWADHHMQKFPDPSRKMRLTWVSFPGEMFCRRHGGEWVIQEPNEEGGNWAY